MHGIILMIAGSILLAIADEPTADTPQCLKIDVESDEFRCSPGGYAPDALTIEECVEGCEAIGFKYAGLQRGTECLCSQTITASVEEEECSTPCTGDPSQLCGSQDLDILLVYAVPEKGALDGVALKITSNEIYTSDTAIVEAEAISTVDTVLKVDFGDGTASKNSEGSTLSVQKHYRIPGQYNVTATATEIINGKTVYSEQVKVTVEEDILDAELECPESIRPGQSINCTATLWRGSAAKFQVEIQDGSGLEEFEIADPTIVSAGLPVPEKEALELSTLPSDELIWLPYVRLPQGRVLGFEFYATTPGDFEFLILRPDCGEESYCLATVSCSGTCSSSDSYTCDSIFSGTGRCVDEDDSCSLVVAGTSYKELHRYKANADKEGYGYHELTEEDGKDVLPGDIVGFECKGGIVGKRNASDSEKEMSLEDTNGDGTKQGVRHYFRALIIQPSRININNTIEKYGKYSVNVTFKNEKPDYSTTEVRYIDVVEPIENMTLNVDKVIVTVGENYILSVSFVKGSEISLVWNYGNGTDEEEFVKDSSSDLEKTIVCLNEGVHNITTSASNIYSSFAKSVQLECFFGITDFWQLSSNSPQPIPPGNVEFEFGFTEEGPMPTRPIAEITFGDGEPELIPLLEISMGPWSTVIHHRYIELQDYEVIVNVSNAVGYKVITTTVELFPGNQDFNITVTHTTDIPKIEQDPEIVDTYVDQDVIFTITFGDDGADYYQMKLDDGIVLYNTTDPVLHHQFKETGVYNATFTAFFYGLLKDYTLTIRIFERLMGLSINHDGTIPGYGVEKRFNITLLIYDEFTCLVFWPGDGSTPEGFGNHFACREKYQDIVYSGPIGEMPMVLKHTYEDQYVTVVKVTAFNALSSLQNEVLAIIKTTEEGAPLVWIYKNHTRISDPDARLRSIEFRLETTTILTSDISYTVLRNWKIYKVDEEANILDEVDISSLASNNASAFVVPPLFLDIGLYKFYYNVCLADEEDEKTCLFISSDYSYVRIKHSPLRPKIIEGDVIMVRRGYGQTLHLKAFTLSSDPDDPADKNFVLTLFCKLKDETFEEDGEGYLVKKNPSTPLKDKSDAGENNGGCFGNGPGIVEMEELDVEFNTGWFKEENAVYDLAIEMEKDTRKSRTSISVEVVTGVPPILIIRCEKSKSCFPDDGMLFFNPGSWITLKAECISFCTEKIKYKWKVWGTKTKTYEDEDQTDLTEVAAAHIRSDKLRIAINQTIHEEFKEYKQFRFEIIGQKEGEPNGRALLYLIRNEPPQGGSCFIKMVEGKALIEYYNFTCSGWIDPETNSDTTVVEYSLLSLYNDESILRLRYGAKTEFPVVLPCGEMKLSASIKDTMGAMAVASVLNITTISPAYEEFLVWNESRAFDRALAEGCTGLAAQIVMAEASCASNYSKGSDDDEMEMVLQDRDYIDEDAVQDRWREYLNLPGKDSSYHTPQAKDEIKEMIREEMEERLDKGMQQKKKRIKKLEKIPVQTMQDAEVKICALSAIVSKGVLDGEGQDMSVRVIEDVSMIINETEITHPDELKHSLTAICTIMDSVATSLSAQLMNGFCFKSNREEAVQKVDYDPDTTNPFVLYVNGGSKKENKQMMRERAFQAAANESRERGREAIEKMKEILDFLTNIVETDMMTNDPTFVTETKTGFVLKILKLPAENFTDMEIDLGRATCKLPSDPCILMGKSLESCSLDEEASISVKATKWSSVLESYSEDASLLGKDSSTVQITTADPETGKSYKHDVTEIDNYVTELETSQNPDSRRRLLQSHSFNSSLEYEENVKKRNADDEMFEICIPRRENPRENISFNRVVPVFRRDSDVIVYHPFQMKSPGVVLVIQIIPDVPEAPFVLFHKCGNKPTLTDNDGIMTLGDLKDENGTYTLNLPSDTCTDGNSTFYFAVGHLANHTDTEQYFSQPDLYNLTVANMTNQFSSNYSYRMYTTGCYYFEEGAEIWDMEGCQVSSASLFDTCCRCNHLTSFGGGLFVAPNAVDFTYVFAHADFTENIVIYVTLIVTFCVYVILLIWARWKDRKDVEKLGATPLPDNDPNDKYIYEILVFTGHQANAGTNSKVFLLVSGEDEETEVRTLADGKRQILRPGSVDIFIMTTPRSLGDLFYLRVWHDNSGKGKWASWYLKYIVFRDVQTGQKFEFIANRWFAVEEGDGSIDHLLPVAGKEQKTEFSHLFNTTTRQKLSDSHLWFSVFLRPPRSRFTRVQRVSCCMAVLYLSMLANAMWYQRTGNQTTSGGFKLGPFSLTLEQLAVGIASNFVVFPPTFLMMFFFRKSRPRKLRPSRIQEALKKQRGAWQAEYGALTSNEGKGRSSHHQPTVPETGGFKRKRKFTLPWWCVIFGWILVFGSIAASLFFLWAYGIQFGNEKTSKWLTSLVISFISSVLLTQPIKIFLVAIFLSMICQKLDYDEDDADEDEEDPHLEDDEEWLHPPAPDRPQRRPYRPLDPKAIEAAREERQKEVKMHSLVREAGAYGIFLWIVIVICMAERDPNCYYMRLNLINDFIKPGDLWVDFNKVNTDRKFWNWTNEALIPELIAGDWYNGRPPLGLRGFLDDRNNLKISYAVMRQVRIKPDSCNVAWQMKNQTPECAGYGTVVFEDGEVYARRWKRNYTEDTEIPPEYKYLTASQLKGYPFWGKMDYYGGGGYVVPLFEKQDDVRETVKRLQREGWINRHTRAIFVEIAVYNAQVNLFGAVTIVAEILPGGGITPYYHVDPIRLLFYHGNNGTFILAVQIVFLVFLLYYTIKVLWNVCKQRFKYFDEYWNICELANVVFSSAGIVFYVLRLLLTQKILKIFRETDGTGYVKLQEAVLLDSMVCYMLACVMFLATLKFLKLLRFNKRMGILASTLRKCAEELRSFGICLMVVFISFVFLFWLLLGRFMWEFSTFLLSFESCISMLLKKFKYPQMAAASPIFVPIVFCIFSIMAATVLVNILLTIIIQSFEEVKQEITKKGKDEEILKFMMNRLKLLVGVGRSRVQPLPPIVPKTTTAPKQDTVDAFPNKVDQLLQFVNTVYCDSQIDFNSKEFLKKMKAGQNPDEGRSSRGTKRRPTALGKYGSESIRRRLGDV